MQGRGDVDHECTSQHLSGLLLEYFFAIILYGPRCEMYNRDVTVAERISGF